MTRFAVEADDGRVFEVEAEDAVAAIERVARERNLRRAGLRAGPVPSPEREWAMPVFWTAVAALVLVVLWAFATGGG